MSVLSSEPPVSEAPDSWACSVCWVWSLESSPSSAVPPAPQPAARAMTATPRAAERTAARERVTVRAVRRATWFMTAFLVVCRGIRRS